MLLSRHKGSMKNYIARVASKVRGKKRSSTHSYKDVKEIASKNKKRKKCDNEPNIFESNGSFLSSTNNHKRNGDCVLISYRKKSIGNSVSSAKKKNRFVEFKIVNDEQRSKTNNDVSEQTSNNSNDDVIQQRSNTNDDSSHGCAERLGNGVQLISPDKQSEGDCLSQSDVEWERESDDEGEEAEFTVGPSHVSRYSLLRSRGKRKRHSQNNNDMDSPHHTSSRNASFRPNTIRKPQPFQRIDKDCYVAVDCEMVGVGVGGIRSVLGRCSIVDYNGTVLYDKYVQSPEPITDYRYVYSGITPEHLATGEDWEVAKQDIHSCLKNKVIVAHAVRNDLQVMNFNPHRYLVRDTSRCPMLVGKARQNGYDKQEHGSIPLKDLAQAILGQSIQTGTDGHDSVEDARATMELFRCVRNGWEKTLFNKWQAEGMDVSQLVQALSGKQEVRDADGMRVTDFRSGCGTATEPVQDNFEEEEENYLNDDFWMSVT